MSEDDFSPARLANRIRAGDRAAEADLIERFERGVSIILRRFLKNRADAEDLSQECFRIALEKIRDGQLRDPERLAGFISSLARNLASDHVRRLIRRKTDTRGPIETVDQNAGPLENLLTSERTAAVRRAIQELPTERDRQLLFRYYIAEEDKAAICNDLGLSSLHFNRVLHRARQRYKELLEGNDGAAA